MGKEGRKKVAFTENYTLIFNTNCPTCSDDIQIDAELSEGIESTLVESANAAASGVRLTPHSSIIQLLRAMHGQKGIFMDFITQAEKRIRVNTSQQQRIPRC